MSAQVSEPGSEEPSLTSSPFSIETSQAAIEDNSQQVTLTAPADVHLDFVDDFLQLRQQMPTSRMSAKSLPLDLRTHP